MPALEVSDLTQTAVLWAQVGYDSYSQATVSQTPVEIPVRWNTNKVERLDAQGNTITYDGEMASDRDINVGSIVWLGAFKDLPLGPIAGKVPTSNLHEVKAWRSAFDVKGRSQRREYGLMRFRDTLPNFAA